MGEYSGKSVGNMANYKGKASGKYTDIYINDRTQNYLEQRSPSYLEHVSHLKNTSKYGIGRYNSKTQDYLKQGYLEHVSHLKNTSKDGIMDRYNTYQQRLWRDVDRLHDYKRLILKESLESILGKKRETRARIEPKGCLSCPLFPVCRGVKNLCSNANEYDLDRLLN